MAKIQIVFDGTEERVEINAGIADNETSKFDGFIARMQIPSRTECVRQMFVEVLPHQERNDRPTVPSEAAIRLQTRIDAEEFVEKIEALYDDPLVPALGKILHAIAKHGTIRKDLHDRLPEFADALADNAVTNEGFAVLFGIDLDSVFREVHRSNMAKKDGPIVDGKRKKPEGWTAPDVVGVLRKQGWQPASETKVDEPIPYRLAEFDSFMIGGKPMTGVVEFAFDPNAERSTCDIHGEPEDEHPCVRCENAQYSGSEIDPIGEQAPGNETSALASLATEASKVEAGPQKEPQRHAIPIDRSVWTSEETFDFASLPIKIEDMPVVDGRVRFHGRRQGRYLMIHIPRTYETFGRYIALLQDEEPCKVSIAGSYLGAARVLSVNRGSKDDMQIEFAKVTFPVDA